jgi:NitT/TauT family transport system permease protein
MRFSLHRNDWFWRVLGVVVILGTWELYGRQLNPLLLPAFSRVMRQLGSIIANGTLLQALGESARLLVSGVLLGTIVGVTLGLVMGRWPLLDKVLDPYLHTVYATPRVAVMPLIILWFGLGFQGKVTIVFLTSFFEVVVATVIGVRHVAGTYIDVARSFVLPERYLYTRVIIPGAFSYILSGVRLGVGHGLVGMVVAELFMESSGIGNLVSHAAEQFRTDRVMAAIIVVALAGVTITALLHSVERWMAPWHKATFE